MTMVQSNNYCEILYQLEEAIQDTGKTSRLLKSNSRTRPGIGLIASYKRRFQSIQIDFSWGIIWGQTIVALGAWYTLLRTLSPQNAETLLADIISLAFQNSSIIFLTLSAVLLLPLLMAFTRGKLSLFWGQLDFDLNGVCHIAPKGRTCTYWSKIMSVEITFWFRGIRLSKENGDYLDLYVPYEDRDDLIKLIKRLIVYYQSDSLIGRRPNSDFQKG